MRAQVDAEVAEYIAKAEAEIQATEAKAQELKSLCWDSMQVGVSVGILFIMASCYPHLLQCFSVWIQESLNVQPLCVDYKRTAVLLLTQTKGALCTGLKSGSIEVNNFPLPAQDEARWAKVCLWVELVLLRCCYSTSLGIMVQVTLGSNFLPYIWCLADRFEPLPAAGCQPQTHRDGKSSS